MSALYDLDLGELEIKKEEQILTRNPNLHWPKARIHTIYVAQKKIQITILNCPRHLVEENKTSLEEGTLKPGPRNPQIKFEGTWIHNEKS